MKKLFLFVLLCLSKQIYAQVETFVGNLPNPTTGYVYFPESCYHMDYKIFDMKGKLINHGRINSLGYINLSTLPSGIYLIKLENQFVNKIIKN